MTNYVNATGAILSTSAISTHYFMPTAGQTIYGTTGNDLLYGVSAGDTQAGGLGDDTYVVLSTADIVVEDANAGTDTVKSYAPAYTLTANVENLIVAGNAWYGGGNGLNNILTAATDGVTLDGGAGNDVLVGSTDTTFVVAAGNGSDRIYSWSATDTIRLSGYGLSSFADVLSIAHQVGNDVILNFANGEKLDITGITLASLSADNFELAINTATMKTVFDDEFNSLNLWNPTTNPTGTWRDDYGIGGYGTVASRTLHGESEVYMDPSFSGTGKTALGVNPFSVSNGVLTITAAPASAAVAPYLDGHTYTSGLITTKQSFSMEYGYFEARVKMPEGQGFWPAFWLLPSNGTWPPEIDIFEQLGKDPNTIYLTSHFTTSTVVNGTVQNVLHIDTTQWHTYGVDWEADYITYYVDGVAVAKQPTPTDMHSEMYMLLDLAVGGSWAGAPDSTTGTGQMQIDYVHAYATSGTVSTTINGVQTVYTATATATPLAAAAPVYAAPQAVADSASLQEGGTLTVNAANGVLANDSHDAALTLTAALASGPSHGSLSLAADGSYVYTPQAGFSGQDSFTYTATDSSGATSTATATLTVNQVLPSAANIAGLTTGYATPFNLSASAILANASDPDGYALSLTGVGSATHGTVTLSNGVVTFTPDAGYSGLATFSYTVADAYGDAATATVSLTVAAEAPQTTSYIGGTSGADVIDKHVSGYGWQISGGAGNDIIMGGMGHNTLNGGAGNDTITGGISADIIIGGPGADTMTGGGGADTFLFAAGNLVSLTTTGTADRIIDFISASAAAGLHDTLVFTGFSRAATLSYVSTNADGSYLYHVTDGANSGDIIIQSGGHKLVSTDYLFM